MASKCPCLARELKDTTAFLKTIAEATRLKIICLLKQKELCVCEIMGALKLPHNLLLHHLKALMKIGLLKKREQGRFTYYRLDQKLLAGFKKQLAKLIN